MHYQPKRIERITPPNTGLITVDEEGLLQGRINDFIIGRKIQNGLSNVYAVVSNSESKLAMKAIDKNQIKEERIESEIEIMSSLHHPNLLTPNQILRTQNYVLIVMDQAIAGDLELLIRNPKKKG